MTDTERLARLLAALEDETYPCPGWHDDADASICPNRVIFSWEHEYDDYYVISSWPEFDGCEAHADRLNEAEPGDHLVERVLGMASERKRLREIAGLPATGGGE